MTTARPRALELWRDYRDDVRSLPGMHVGTVSVPGPISTAFDPGAEAGFDAAQAAREFHDSGVRRAELVTIADLTAAAAAADPAQVIRVLDLVRELTAWGVVVDWRVRLDEAGPSAAELCHLYPPRQIEGPGDAAELRSAWAEGFFLGKCVARRGAGFLEIRDHRAGVLSRIVIDEPEYLAAVDSLQADPSGAGVSGAVLADLAGESLLLGVGTLYWWAPYRPRRWPQPPFHV